MRTQRFATYVAGLVVLTTALLMHVTPVRAQDTEETLDEEGLPSASLVGEAGYAYQGEADIDGGGKFSVSRFDVGAIGRFDPFERWRSTNTIFFSGNDYDFEGGGFSTGDPWETILTLRMVSRLRYQYNDQWGVFVGGVFIFSPESDANWGDSFSGGGMAGVDFRPSDKFFLSLGVAAISQIEDDPRVTPAIILNWLPYDRWAVRVGAIPASGGAATAGEVAYRIAEPLELGLGVIFNQRRFRLNDSGPVPNGIGEDNAMPVRLRLGWRVMPQISLHLLAGAALAGELRIDDRFGNRLGAEDYDPAPYVGLRILGWL